MEVFQLCCRVLDGNAHYGADDDVSPLQVKFNFFLYLSYGSIFASRQCHPHRARRYFHINLRTVGINGAT